MLTGTPTLLPSGGLAVQPRKSADSRAKSVGTNEKAKNFLVSGRSFGSQSSVDAAAILAEVDQPGVWQQLYQGVVAN